MLRFLAVALAVALAVYCVFDVLGSDARRRRELPAVLWVLVVVVLPVVGGVIWLLVSRNAPHGPAGRAGRGPVAPDDDPEFLFRLDQERRRREQREGRRPDDAGDAPTS